MEIKFKKDEFEYCGLVKLGNLQKFIDPKWKDFGIENFWYHKFIIKNNEQIIYVLNKNHYYVASGWDQHPPVKFIRHRNGDITINFNHIKSEIGDVYLY